MVTGLRIGFLLPVFYLLPLALHEGLLLSMEPHKSKQKMSTKVSFPMSCIKSVTEQELVWSDQHCLFVIAGQPPLFHAPCILFSSIMTAFSFHLVISCIPLPKELRYICRSNVILPLCIRPCSFCRDSRLILTESSMYVLPGFCFSK